MYLQTLQLTNFKSGTASSDSNKDNFLSLQQKDLFQFVNEEKAKSEWNKSQSEEKKLKFPGDQTTETRTRGGSISPAQRSRPFLR